MQKSNYALRLQPSLMKAAKEKAASEGVALNQFINVAVAEKLSAMDIEEFFRQKAEQGNLKIALVALRPPKSNEPLLGDEMPPLLKARKIRSTRKS